MLHYREKGKNKMKKLLLISMLSVICLPSFAVRIFSIVPNVDHLTMHQNETKNNAVTFKLTNNAGVTVKDLTIKVGSSIQSIVSVSMGKGPHQCIQGQSLGPHKSCFFYENLKSYNVLASVHEYPVGCFYLGKICQRDKDIFISVIR